MKPILRWFFAGSIAGSLGLPASSARAQSPAGSFDRALVEKGQEEIPGTITPTAPFPPIPEVLRGYSGADPDAGFRPGPDEHPGLKNRGEEARRGYDQGHRQGQGDPAHDGSGSDAEDDY
jgi:hypothetical protein